MDNITNPQIQSKKERFLIKNSKIISKLFGAKQIQNYLIKQKIGAGSFAKVYKAIHIPTGQHVAVKIINKNKMTAQELKNVYFEVETQKKLFHTNIARIYDFYEDKQKIYIFMELCKNGQLFTYINKNGPVSQKFAAKIFKQILSAMKYLKSQRLFHRDIKSQNIMFDHKWNAKLVDFGFVTKQEDGCFSSTFCGSPSYTAPQMAKRQKYHSQMIDVWCIGVTLYAMLAGQLPFQGKKPFQTVNNIVEIKYQMKKSFSSSVRKLLSNIFTRQEQRLSIQDLQQQQFCYSGYPIHTNFINTNNDEITVDPYILELLKAHNSQLNTIELIQSVTMFKLDSYYSLYYLTIQKQILKNNQNIKYDIASVDFQKKKKRSTTLKLMKVNNSNNDKNSMRASSVLNSQLLITPEIKGKKDNFRVRSTQITIDINSARLRKRDDSPQSPKRILDLVAAYRKRI